MPLQCDSPFCTTLAMMLGEGAVAMTRIADEARCHVHVVWFREGHGRIDGDGANVRDAVTDACEKRLCER